MHEAAMLFGPLDQNETQFETTNNLEAKVSLSFFV